MKADIIDNKLCLYPESGAEKYGLTLWLDNVLECEYARQGEIDCPVSIEDDAFLQKEL